jgi:hypothetical protein
LTIGFKISFEIRRSEVEENKEMLELVDADARLL